MDWTDECASGLSLQLIYKWLQMVLDVYLNWHVCSGPEMEREGNPLGLVCVSAYVYVCTCIVCVQTTLCHTYVRPCMCVSAWQCLTHTSLCLDEITFSLTDGLLRIYSNGMLDGGARSYKRLSLSSQCVSNSSPIMNIDVYILVKGDVYDVWKKDGNRVRHAINSNMKTDKLFLKKMSQYET